MVIIENTYLLFLLAQSFSVDTVDKIALIRDIFIIVNSAVFIIILIGLGLMAFRVYRQFYPSVLRTSRNLEEGSGILLSLVSQPMNLIGSALEVINRVWGLVENFKNRERRNDDDGEQ